MLRVKKRGLTEPILLAVFFSCIGLASNAEALELKLPVSIHEILSPEKITEVRANPAVKEIQQGLRKQSMSEQAGGKSSVMMGGMNPSVVNAIQKALKKRTQSKENDSEKSDIAEW